MFARVEAVAAALAAARVRARIAQMAGREVPGGVAVAADGDKVVMTGRGLRRRLATDAALRWWRS